MERLRERRKYQNSMLRSEAGKGSARDGSQVSAQTGPQMDRELKEIRDRKWCFGSKQSHEIPFRLADFEGVLRYPGADV